MPIPINLLGKRGDKNRKSHSEKCGIKKKGLSVLCRRQRKRLRS